MKVISPLYLELGKKKIKRYHLGLNQYRNRHFIVSNNLKIKYKEVIKPQLENRKKINCVCKFLYTYYHPTQRKSDIENVCIIHNKFFQDTLTELGILQDDNYTIIQEIVYRYGGYDKDNGRVEIELDYENKVR